MLSLTVRQRLENQNQGTYFHFYEKLVREVDPSVKASLFKTFLRCLVAISSITLLIESFVNLIRKVVVSYYNSFYDNHHLYLVHLGFVVIFQFLILSLIIFIFFNQYARNSFKKILLISCIINIIIFGCLLFTVSILYHKNDNNIANDWNLISTLLCKARIWSDSTYRSDSCQSNFSLYLLYLYCIYHPISLITMIIANQLFADSNYSRLSKVLKFDSFGMEWSDMEQFMLQPIVDVNTINGTNNANNASCVIDNNNYTGDCYNDFSEIKMKDKIDHENIEMDTYTMEKNINSNRMNNIVIGNTNSENVNVNLDLNLDLNSIKDKDSKERSSTSINTTTSGGEGTTDVYVYFVFGIVWIIFWWIGYLLGSTNPDTSNDIEMIFYMLLIYTSIFKILFKFYARKIDYLTIKYYYYSIENINSNSFKCNICNNYYILNFNFVYFLSLEITMEFILTTIYYQTYLTFVIPQLLYLNENDFVSRFVTILICHVISEAFQSILRFSRHYFALTVKFIKYIIWKNEQFIDDATSINYINSTSQNYSEFEREFERDTIGKTGNAYGNKKPNFVLRWIYWVYDHHLKDDSSFKEWQTRHSIDMSIRVFSIVLVNCYLVLYHLASDDINSFLKNMGYYWILFGTDMMYFLLLFLIKKFNVWEPFLLMFAANYKIMTCLFAISSAICAFFY